MGMFDEITGKIKCPKCGSVFEVIEQVKWTHKRRCCRYYVGDNINADDGIYTYGSDARNTLYNYCPKCGVKILFSVSVKRGILQSIEPVTDKTDIS